jgi:hypothetical protein
MISIEYSLGVQLQYNTIQRTPQESRRIERVQVRSENLGDITIIVSADVAGIIKNPSM